MADSPASGAMIRASLIRSADWSSRRRGVPSWALSAVFHFVVLIAAALLVRVAPKRADVEPDRRGGIVLVEQTRRGNLEYYSDTEAEESAASNAAPAAETLAESLPSQQDLSVNFAGVLPSRQEVFGSGGDLADILPGAGTLTEGSQPNKQIGGGQAQTSVFGVQGVGTTFVYVFDRSGSMEGFGGRPLAAAKRELIASLKNLESTHQFQIIFYNDDPDVFNPDRHRRPRLLFGSDSEKQAAGNFVRGIVAAGGTRHMEALQLAVGMAPDVIFFLTDADEPKLTNEDLAQVARWNRAGTTIHAIEFGSTVSPRASNFLMRLARQNGGKHTYVDISKLPSR